MKSERLLVYALLVFASLSWAGSFIVVRLTHQEIPPFMLGFLRFVIATPVMFLILLVLKKHLFISIKKLPQLIVLALSGVTLLYMFQFTGVSLTSASTGGVLINTNVLFISLFSAHFFHERFTKLKLVGIVISFIGVIFVFFGQMSNETIAYSESFLLGSILVILSAICWAIYSIVGKHMLEKEDPLVINANVFLLGTLFFLPFVYSDINIVVSNISISGVIAVLYLGLFCSVFAYIAWYFALSKSEAAESAVFLNLIPLFTILLSMFIGEFPTPLFLLGAGFIIAGVILVQKIKLHNNLIKK